MDAPILARAMVLLASKCVPSACYQIGEHGQEIERKEEIVASHMLVLPAKFAVCITWDHSMLYNTVYGKLHARPFSLFFLWYSSHSALNLQHQLLDLNLISHRVHDQIQVYMYL